MISAENERAIRVIFPPKPRIREGVQLLNFRTFESRLIECRMGGKPGWVILEDTLPNEREDEDQLISLKRKLASDVPSEQLVTLVELYGYRFIRQSIYGESLDLVDFTHPQVFKMIVDNNRLMDSSEPHIYRPQPEVSAAVLSATKSNSLERLYMERCGLYHLQLSEVSTKTINHGTVQQIKRLVVRQRVSMDRAESAVFGALNQIYKTDDFDIAATLQHLHNLQILFQEDQVDIEGLFGERAGRKVSFAPILWLSKQPINIQSGILDNLYQKPCELRFDCLWQLVEASTFKPSYSGK